MLRNRILSFKKKSEDHLTRELLPFWTSRIKDTLNGGYLTHFDKDGEDTGEDEKSLIAQTRSLYTLSAAHRAGYGDGICDKLAHHGCEFLIDKFWDNKHGGFYWMANQKGEILDTSKVVYGHSFAIYALSEYSLATGDPEGLKYAMKTFDILQDKCYDPVNKGYFEMFNEAWELKGPGAGGGDRKTLDVHMHLMESFTTLFECSQEGIVREKLEEVIQLLIDKMLHPVYKTGIPQFTPQWEVASQIKFDIIWGWDRYVDGGEKSNPTDNTCYGHNAEFAWLLLHAIEILNLDIRNYESLLSEMFKHTVENGIDWKFGGVFVEGPHSGGVYDMEKEFWQQAEVLIGMLDAFLLTNSIKYWEAYENVADFIFDKVVNHRVGEWWPLLDREGNPIWTHMSHSWKINYHTIRSMIQSIQRLDQILENKSKG